VIHKCIAKNQNVDTAVTVIEKERNETGDVSITLVVTAVHAPRARAEDKDTERDTLRRIGDLPIDLYWCSPTPPSKEPSMFVSAVEPYENIKSLYYTTEYIV
jgi:hypothetical protein